MTSNLLFFVLLAKYKNLSATARALDITPPAATKRLIQLEKQLGVRLANRTTRSINLTAEGELYLSQATKILADIKAMEDSLANNRVKPRGLLRVNTTLGFGRKTIAALVSEFAMKYPEIEVDLQVSDKPVDLIENNFDMAIRFGSLPDTRLVARCLLHNRRYLCASPKYLKKYGNPQNLSELASHRCIIHNQNDEAHGVWRFTHHQNTEVIKIHGALVSNDGDIALGWALDGHGIMIRSEWDLKKYLDSKRLQIILPEFTLESADLFVYYPSRQNLPARVRTLIEFLVAYFDALDTKALR